LPPLRGFLNTRDELLVTEIYGWQARVRISIAALTGLASVLLLFPIPATAQDSQKSSMETVPATPSGSIAGKILTVEGIALPGLEIRLLNTSADTALSVRSDNTGEFAFAGLPPGMYRVTVDDTVARLASPAEVDLAPGQQYRFPSLVARLLSRTSVNVVATEAEIAQAQVKQQEKQRVLGFIPNFYTIYIWDAAPMRPKLKFQLAFKSLVDPMTFVATAAIAGVEQKHNTFPGYEQEGEGYARRFAATYADTVSHRLLASAVFPSIFHQDPRYFYQGSGTVRSRFFHAVLSTVICKGDHGTWEPNYSQFAGAFAASGLSNVYRSPSDRQAGLTVRNGLIILGGYTVTNILREFVSRQLTSNVPDSANGKP
jgi:hypothetical protein